MLGLLGYLGYDGVALMTATFGVADRANTYANDAATSYKSTHDINKTYELIVTEAAANQDTVDPKTFSVDASGTAHLTAHHVATTLWMQHLGFLRKYTHVSGKGEGAPFT
ncbi:MAG: hypothetical protein ACXVGH_06870 [Mycobacteriales bacterium]